MSDRRRPTPPGSTTPASAPDDRVSGAARPSDSAPGLAPTATSAADILARELSTSFREHVRRSLGIELDGSITSLAFVDHYLRTARNEQRAPIVALVAAEAGAYYGELVRNEIGATWIGDREDPRRLRLLMRHQFLWLAPIDQAFEALLGPVDDTDERFPTDTALDTTFHARATAPPGGGEDDASWLADRLAELPPVGEEEYYTLTCRFETLKLVLELLAAKHAGAGERPREYLLTDYVASLSSG